MKMKKLTEEEMRELHLTHIVNMCKEDSKLALKVAEYLDSQKK